MKENNMPLYIDHENNWKRLNFCFWKRILSEIPAKNIDVEHPRIVR
jgi:hypothetical protein